MKIMVSRPRTKEEIVECDDSSGVEEDGPMDDEEDLQIREIQQCNKIIER